MNASEVCNLEDRKFVMYVYSISHGGVLAENKKSVGGY